MSQLRQSAIGNGQIDLQLADGLTFHAIGDRKAIFSEPLQKLYELNDVTAYLACRIVDKATVSELEADLIERGLSPADAKSALRQFMLEWSRERQLKIHIPAERLGPATVINLSICGHAFAVRCYQENIAAAVNTVFGHFASKHDANATVFSIVCDGDIAFVSEHDANGYTVRYEQVIPTLKGVLTEAILIARGDRLALHCATLTRHGKAFLLSGQPGAGKTVLTLAMMQCGFAFAGDDIVLLADSGLVTAIPFLPALKQEAWSISDQVGISSHQLQTHLRLDNIPTRYAPVVVEHLNAPIPVAAIIDVSRSHTVEPSIERVDIAYALRHLIAGAYGKDQKLTAAQLQLLNRLVSGVDRVTLHYSDAREAAARLDARYAAHA